jgi:hypothetical protein
MLSAWLDHAKGIATVVGWVGSVGLFSIAVLTYRRTQQWKKAEFLAAEMKLYFAIPRVQRTLVMLDWGRREIELLEDEPAGKNRVVVTREMQTFALRPHTLVNGTGSDSEVDTRSNGMAGEGFTAEETAIRDCYDTFLDGLERFSSYVETKLVDRKALRPYIGYWVDDIASPTNNAADAAWCAALLTYVSFYRYEGVLRLFEDFDQNIRPSSATYISFLKQMTDQKLASAFAATVNRSYEEVDKVAA